MQHQGSVAALSPGGQGAIILSALGVTGEGDGISDSCSRASDGAMAWRFGMETAGGVEMEHGEWQEEGPWYDSRHCSLAEGHGSVVWGTDGHASRRLEMECPRPKAEGPWDGEWLGGIAQSASSVERQHDGHPRSWLEVECGVCAAESREVEEKGSCHEQRDYGITKGDGSMAHATPTGGSCELCDELAAHKEEGKAFCTRTSGNAKSDDTMARRPCGYAGGRVALECGVCKEEGERHGRWDGSTEASVGSMASVRYPRFIVSVARQSPAWPRNPQCFQGCAELGSGHTARHGAPVTSHTHQDTGLLLALRYIAS